jgi:excisionase family DNA binding protein
MKYRNTQFAARKNPDSPRVHGLRLKTNSSFSSLRGAEDSCERDRAHRAQGAVGSYEGNRMEVESHVRFEPLLDVAQAAKLLGIHPKTLQRLARIGSIPAYRVGRFWRYRASDIEMWLRCSANSNRQPADRVDFTQEKTQ